MPRSHELLQEDAAATAAEFTGQYGIHPNAEALLLAHQAAQDPALEAASRKPVDDEATKELDLSSIEPSGGGKVLDAVVRGNAVVYVAQGPDGRTYKGFEPREGYEAPAEDPSAAGLRAGSKAEMEMARLTAIANTNIEAKVAEFRAELQEQAAEQLASAREEVQSEAEEAAEEAQKAAEESSGGEPEAPTQKASAATARSKRSS
jgi:hypothetical protein